MPPIAVEAMECLGGNGYVEEAPLARLYREAPLNGIWEGSGNVICLDVLRAIARAPESLAALEDEIARRGDARIAGGGPAVERLRRDPAGAEGQARAVVEALAICAQASLMMRFSDRTRRGGVLRIRAWRMARGRSARCPQGAISRRDWSNARCRLDLSPFREKGL